MSSTLRIRRIRKADLHQLVLLLKQYAKWSGDKNRVTEAHLAEYCLGSKRMADAWLALLDDKAVGFALTGEWVSFGGPFKVRHIYHLFVSEKFRAQDIATKLIQHIMKDAFVKGCARVDTAATPNNKEANKLYKQLGFTTKSTSTGYQLYRP